MLLTREERKEKPPPSLQARGRGATPSGGATASTGEPDDEEEEVGPPRPKISVHYCCLDYPSLLEATQWRMHQMRGKLKEQDKGRCDQVHAGCMSIYRDADCKHLCWVHGGHMGSSYWPGACHLDVHEHAEQSMARMHGMQHGNMHRKGAKSAADTGVLNSNRYMSE